MEKAITQVSSIIRLIILKLKYGKSLVFGDRVLRSKILSKNNIKINKATIELRGPLTIGKSSRISANSGGEIVIEKKVFINTGCVICSKGKMSIGQNTSIGPNCCIYDHDHIFDKNGKKDGFRIGKVLIGNNVWIGANTVILRDTIIGDNSVIGAGAVVKGNIPKESLVVSDRKNKVKELYDKGIQGKEGTK